MLMEPFMMESNARLSVTKFLGLAMLL
jgi:hypothetical protein